MKNISLSQEVKTIVRVMISNAKKFNLEELTIFLLFDSMMSQKQFSSLIAKYSRCNLEEIISLIEDIYQNNPDGFEEKGAETLEETQYFINVLKESSIDNFQYIRFSQYVANIFLFANILAESDENDELNLSHLTLALFNNLNSQLISFFTNIGTNVEQLLSYIEYLSLLDSCCENDSDLVIPDSISGCVTILNDRFKAQKSSAILGRDKECKEIWKTIMKKTKRNVILVGKPGVGKSSIVYKLACDIVNGNCPSMFKNSIILSLSVSNLISGTTYRGQAEKRYQDLISLIEKYDNIILFIDEIHMIVGAGACSNDESLDFSNALKPLLAGDKSIVIGATTEEEYQKAFSKEGALKRRFRTIEVKEPKAEEVYPMLKESVKRLEQFHGVKISRKMIDKIIFYSSCFDYTTCNPDRTISLVDLSMVSAKLANQKYVTQPAILENFETNFKAYKKMPQDVIRATAYHEVGHYIVSRFSKKLIDFDVLAITIIPTENYLGKNVLDPTDITPNPDLDYYYDFIGMYLAGRISETIFLNARYNSGASSDLDTATKYAYDMVTKYGMRSDIGTNRVFLNTEQYHMQTSAITDKINAEIDKIIKNAYDKAANFLKEHSKLIHVLVDKLLENGILSKLELEEIIKSVESSGE